MELENIRYVNFEEPDRRRVQELAIKATRDDPGKLLKAYRADARSFEGRYVAADLFKEVFPEFSASKEGRNRYNNPVHNSAAVLSSALFSENLGTERESGRDTVYFLTGSPGAGKTSLVLGTGRLPRDAHMVFEGQMSNYETSHAKIKQVLEAGLKARILVAHVRSEDALDKTLLRFNEEGRGSSIATIARIQGGLPDSLTRLGAYFGDDLAVDIMDLRNRDNPVHLRGHANIHILKSEGTHEHIQQRLEAQLEQYRRDGRISDDAYRQAAGLPLGRGHGMGSGRDGHGQETEPGRGVSPESRVAPVLTPSPSNSHRARLEGHSPLKITDANKLPASAKAAGIRGHVIEVDDEHVLIRTGKSDAVRFARSDIRGNVEVGKPIEMQFKAREQRPELERKHGLNND